MPKFFVSWIALFFLTAAQAKDVEFSWEKAVVHVPGTFFSKSTKDLVLEKKYPAIIYLHGCTGIQSGHDIQWAKLMAAQNFVVVLPDSMARPNRLSNCDPKLQGGTNIFPAAYEYRQQEISYAKDQIMKSSWWDQKNIFLAGHSEGGIATAQSTHGGFNGLFISGWTCTHKNNPSFDGLKSPIEIPAIAVASVDDSWRKGKFNEGRCATKSAGRNLTQIDLPGREHNTYDSRFARDSVVKFLNENLKP
jgi:dienelactone hydrolase